MSDLSNVAESSLIRSEPNGYQRMHKHYNILPFDEMKPYEDSINRFFTKNRAARNTTNHPGTPPPPSPFVASESSSPTFGPQLPRSLQGPVESSARRRQPNIAQNSASSAHGQDWRGASEVPVSPPRNRSYNSPLADLGLPVYNETAPVGRDSAPPCTTRDIPSSTAALPKDEITPTNEPNTSGSPSALPRKMEPQLQMGFAWNRESLALLYKAKAVTKKGIAFIAASGVFPGHDTASLKATWAQHKAGAKVYYQEVYGD